MVFDELELLAAKGMEGMGYSKKFPLG